MIASFLLLGDSERPTRERARQVILDFIIKYCKTGNMFTDFDFDVMTEMLGSRGVEVLTEFFQLGVLYRSVSTLRRPTPDWTTYLNFPEYPDYVKAFLKVFGSLPEDRKRAIAIYVKTRLERDWLLGIPPDEKYIHAVAQGGELVHLPMRCPKCRGTVVVAKGVEEMYRDVARGLLAKCPKCGSVLGRPRWVPWYGEWTGRV